MRENIKNKLNRFTIRLRLLRYSTSYWLYRLGQRFPRTARMYRARRRWVQVGAVLIILVVVVGSNLFGPSASAKSVTLGSKDLLAGTTNYSQISLKNNATAFGLQRGDIGTWSGGDNLQSPQTMVYGDSSLIYGPNNSLYFMTYFAGCHLQRFEFDTQKWVDLKLPPEGCGQGSVLLYDNAASFYYLPGGNSAGLYKYDIDSDSWTTLAEAPSQVGSGAGGVFTGAGNNQALYIARGNSSASMFKYDIQANTWTAKASFPATLGTDQGLALAYDGSNTIYASTNYHGEFKKYSLSSDTWTNLATEPSMANRRGMMQYVNGKIYATAAYCCATLNSFLVYDVLTNTWTQGATLPVGTYYSFRPPVAYDGGDSVYTLLGADQRPQIYKYSISAGTWDKYSLFSAQTSGNYQHMEPVFDGGQNAYYIGATGAGAYAGVYQENLSTGANTLVGGQISTTVGLTGAYKGGALYFMGMSNTQFAKYDLSSNAWTSLPNEPLTSSSGANIIDGGNGNFYATFGGGSGGFYKYSDAGGWQALASMPAGSNVTSGMSKIGNYIYVLIGNSSPYLVRYDMTANTWTILYTPSGTLYWGSAMAGDSSRYLYVNTGTYTYPGARHMFRYDTTNGTWLRIADLPQNARPYASAFYDTTNNKLWFNQGYDTSHIWSWTPTSAAYQTTGTWYSGTMDLTNVATWSGLTYSSPGSGTVTAYTRTSAKGGLWSAWQAVTGSTINSPTNRYIQLKFVLTGDGTATPTVSNIAVNYTQDSTPPNLPSQFSALGSSDQGAQSLVSGTTYQYQHPYFSWSGATDNNGGSGVAGYYVYYGTDSNADPTQVGNYQTSANYTVTTAMTAGGIYYVRIAVKDAMGNVSPAATYFSYRYFYISPPGSQLQSTQADFAAGTNSGVSISNNGMQLNQQAAGTWDTGVMKPLPANTSGPAETVVGNYLYVLRGSTAGDFWRYDLVAKTWSTLSSLPVAVNTGSALTWDKGKYIYAMAGNGTNAFYRYDIQNDAWMQLPNLPDNAYSGADLTYLGNGTIAVMFSSVSEFYFYNISSGTFTARTSAPSVISTNAGSGIYYDGKDTIYAYLGAYDQYQTGRRSLVAYSIAQDSWRYLAVPDFDVVYPENNLVGDGNGHLYVFGTDYAANKGSKNLAERYDIASDTWTTLPNVSIQDIRGTATSDGSRFIYIIPSGGAVGSDSRRIYRYDTWNDSLSPQDPQLPSWQRVTNSLVTAWQWQAGNATTMAYDGDDYVYMIGGDDGNFNQFYRYSLSTKTGTYLPPAPIVGLGGSLTFSGGSLYYAPARNTNFFYKYDFDSRSWLSMATVPANIYRPGSNMLITANNGSLYAVAGNGKLLYKYVPDSGTGSWTRMADAPANILYGAATYDGSDSIYVMGGNGTNAFYRYSIANNTWTTIANYPTTTNNGGATLLYNSGTIYATSGNSTNTSYQYNVANNSWSAGPTTPELFRAGGEVLNIGGQYAFAIAGDNSPDTWRFQFPSGGTAYDGSATHISQVFSMQGLFDYAGIQSQVNIPANTAVEYWTRTSADGVNWDDWSIADQIKQYNGEESMHITSRPQSYIQVKVIMYSYDNKYTPTVANYSVDYYYDVTPPNNPTLLTVSTDSTKQTALTTNTWYNTANPYIEWPAPGQTGGATDGPLGSNIKGYWVYVGTDPTAVPRTAGVFVQGTNYTPTLTTSGTYYIRMQAVDMTGNVDPSIFAPYVYKFDNAPPTNPAFITVTPSGFTSINKYTFQWPAGFDADSGISGYCYHTGALSGPLAVETCQQGLSLTDLQAAYRSGTNVFYIRTLDNAGNYSPSYTTVSFYYSTDPPSPVTNLRAIPPTSPQNLFAFTWDLPSNFSGDPNQLTYCYSVNELPSPLNTTCTADKFLAPFKAATQQGTNIIYVVAKDEAGNVNWNNYASGNFIANTVSPGIPLNVVIGDTSDQSSGRYSLTLTWDPPTFAGNGVAGYVIQRSDDGHAFTDLGQGSNNAYVDLSVTPGQMYYYRIIAQDNVENRGGPSAVVSDKAVGNYSTPPDIVSAPAVVPGFDKATVNWVTSRPATTFVYYGTTPTNLSQSVGVLDLSTTHSQLVTGLEPSTVYYYKVQSFDNARDYDLSNAYSQLGTFTTTAAAQIYNVDVSDVGLTSALVHWQTSVPTTSQISYGTDITYGYSQEDPGGLTTDHTFKIDSLQSGTGYHFRINATTEGKSVIKSDDYHFSTVPRPSVSNVRFQPLQQAATIAVEVTWDTNVPTSSDILYSALGEQKEASTGALVTHHDITIDGLAGNTDYTMNISGRDQYGNLTSSSSQVWHSQVDTRPPTISNFSVTSSTMDALNGAKAQLIVTWKTDEPSTTQLSYSTAGGKKLSLKSSFNPEPTTTHVVVLPQLDLASVYRIQPISRDISGNTSFGVQLATVTPDQQESVLNNVLNLLQKVFRL